MADTRYHGKVFRSVVNSPNGEVDGQTAFVYFQTGGTLWGLYGGGSIVRGTLTATVNPQGVLDMRYAHVSTTGDLRTGRCRSAPEVLPDGRLRLHEDWQWTSGDGSRGQSVVEEVVGAEASAIRKRLAPDADFAPA